MAEVAASWTTLRSFMKERCGVLLAEDQHYLMEARLAPVAKTLKYATVDDYVLEACRPGAAKTVVSPLVDAMTTHETYFFRDTGFWKVFTETIIPKVATAAGPLRIWSAACSSGQEPYTMAMIFEEKFPHLVDRVQIVATDISEGVLEVGRRGSYTVFEVNRGVTAPRLMRHFERDEGHFRVKERLRRMVTWTPQNLISSPPPGENFDVVLVRNVLIYFPEGPRLQVLAKMRAAVKPQGFLGIGSTEVISSLVGTAVAPGWYPR
jgi:chemotaxis protein methyltransferase CheR